MNSKVDSYLQRAKQWQAEFEALRAIILECHLTEESKWGHPCYTFQNGNVVLMHGFKHYCALLFFKGALLRDESGVLVRQTENVQAARQVRFTSVREIADLESLLKSYLHEAIELEKAGREVDYRKTAEYSVPAELENSFEKNPALRTAFQALTPGRQRAYLLHFSAPKQSKTREARIENCVQRILDGKGWRE